VVVFYLSEQLLDMLAIIKATAAKLTVLWNLPALLLLICACEAGTTISI
tara:strand:+ start:116 stop:262 length:147 start_codon:yes stop_codon:yes gene_type:complete